MSISRAIWLDCDPGHDDATAILLAIHSPAIELLGVSTVHGNADALNTASNAARCLHAFAAPPHIKVHPGASKPLCRPVIYAPEIHGSDGLGGVEGLPHKDHADVKARIDLSVPAIQAMAEAVRKTWDGGKGRKVSLLASGPLTNIALFVSVYPQLLEEAVEQIVFMGGGVGIGNKSAVAEFNILCDPEAAQVVLDAPVPSVMLPLNVTHLAIVTPTIHSHLLSAAPFSSSSATSALIAQVNATLPKSLTPLRHTLSTLITFFKEAYETIFGFHTGPPLHDALTVAYVIDPTLFPRTKRFRVDVELTGALTTGETVVDLWNYKNCGEETWGRAGKNCLVTEGLEVDAFFKILLDCVAKCDAVSPLNHKQ